MDFPDVTLLAIPLYLALIGLELWIGRRTGRARFTMVDSATSIAMGLGSVITPLFGGAALVGGAMAAVYQVRLFDIPMTLWAGVLCFVVDDFRYYWWHRLSHERRLFWASHVVHHSSRHYNLTTALRQPWTGVILSGLLFKVPLVWLGFPPALVILVGGINLVYQFWIHTETIDRLGPFEWVMNTPSHHRVHHATNPEYLDANYAGVFIIWDRLFGTFALERREDAPRYGIIKNLQTHNPLVVAFHEWIALGRDVLSARRLAEGTRYVFSRPGWRPGGQGHTSIDIKREAAARPSPNAREKVRVHRSATIDGPDVTL